MLQQQHHFLSASLAAVDGSASDDEDTTPSATDQDSEWLATELINLKAQSGALQEQMRRLRKKCMKKAVGSRKKEIKGPNKRLSIEDAKKEEPEKKDSAQSTTPPPWSPLGNGKRQRLSAGPREDDDVAPTFMPGPYTSPLRTTSRYSTPASMPHSLHTDPSLSNDPPRAFGVPRGPGEESDTSEEEEDEEMEEDTDDDDEEEESGTTVTSARAESAQQPGDVKYPDLPTAAPEKTSGATSSSNPRHASVSDESDEDDYVADPKAEAEEAGRAAAAAAAAAVAGTLGQASLEEIEANFPETFEDLSEEVARKIYESNLRHLASLPRKSEKRTFTARLKSWFTKSPKAKDAQDEVKDASGSGDEHSGEEGRTRSGKRMRPHKGDWSTAGDDSDAVPAFAPGAPQIPVEITGATNGAPHGADGEETVFPANPVHTGSHFWPSTAAQDVPSRAAPSTEPVSGTAPVYPPVHAAVPSTVEESIQATMTRVATTPRKKWNPFSALQFKYQYLANEEYKKRTSPTGHGSGTDETGALVVPIEDTGRGKRRRFQ